MGPVDLPRVMVEPRRDGLVSVYVPIIRLELLVNPDQADALADELKAATSDIRGRNFPGNVT